MSTYEPDDTKGTVGKILGSIFGVPPVLLADDDNEDDTEAEVTSEPQVSESSDSSDT